MTAPRRAAVLGHPIAHSLSPALHRAAYEALGLDGWRYDAVDVTEEELPAFVAGLDAGWAGLSLTMPLKHAVLGLLHHVEPLAQVVGAVNTVLVQAVGTGVVLTGANTDVYGLVQALREGLRDGAPARQAPLSAVVLGGGATAASTVAALAELGVVRPVVLARSPGRAGALLRATHRMGVDVQLRSYAAATARSTIVAADLVVSTLPPRAADELAAAVGDDLPAPRGVLLDVAYDPRPTALSHAWGRAGGTVVEGERMLLHQAAEQVRLMTGRPAPIDAMDAALRATRRV